MTIKEVRDCINKLRKAGTDLTHIEAKRSKNELPKRIWESISALSNTERGGLLILGISEDAGFAVEGLAHPNKIQQDLASICSDMEPPVRAHIEMHRIEGKAVITAEIPELPIASKPCYFPGAGLTNGAFIRVADGDRKLTPYEVQMMLAARGQPRDDEEPIPKTTTADLQPLLVKGLVGRLRKRPSTRLEKLSDESVLRMLKVLVPLRNGWACSLGGLLALGKYPQQFFPALGLTFVVYPGATIGEPGANQERFLDNSRIDGAIPDILGPMMSVLRRNMKQRSVVKGLYREDVDEYPATAVRECVINSLVHRDLSPQARGTPVQVQMFSDRMVVTNPGGLYGPVTIDLLGREGVSSARNNMMLRLLEDLTPDGEKQAVCENRGSGMSAILSSLGRAGLRTPIFDNRIASFRVTLYNSSEERERASLNKQRKDRRTEIIDLLRAQGSLSRAEISQGLRISEPATRKWLSIMRDEQLITTTETKTRSKNMKYAIPAAKRKRT